LTPRSWAPKPSSNSESPHISGTDRNVPAVGVQ
jgi:hypothetical protein